MRVEDPKPRPRSTYVRGEAHHKAKLTREIVLQIRKAWRLGLATQRELAAQYHVCQKTVWKVLKRKTWWHV